jgi:transposase
VRIFTCTDTRSPDGLDTAEHSLLGGSLLPCPALQMCRPDVPRVPYVGVVHAASAMDSAAHADGRYKRGRFGNPAKHCPGGASLSIDSKKTIVHMYLVQGKEIPEIAASIPSPRGRVHVTERTVKNVINEFVTIGEVAPPGKASGRTRTMSDAHGRALLEIVDENPWLYLDEISDELNVRCGARYHGMRCYEELRRRGFTLKVRGALSPNPAA